MFPILCTTADGSGLRQYSRLAVTHCPPRPSSPSPAPPADSRGTLRPQPHQRRTAEVTAGRSVGKPAVGGVPELLQVGLTGEVDHGRRSTHDHQSVGPGRRQVLLEHVSRDEPAAVLPVCRTRDNGQSHSHGHGPDTGHHSHGRS